MKSIDNNELVSIITPCYNGSKYLKTYLESVLDQTYSNIELVFIDDGSTDNSEQIFNEYIERFKDKGYKCIFDKQNMNSGIAASINKGLKLFTGDYMMWMDVDDIFYPEAIEKKVQYLRINKDIDFVLNQAELVRNDNIYKTIDILKREHNPKNDNLFKDLLDEKNVVFAPGVIFVRSDVIKSIIPKNGIYEGREGQNYQLMLPLAYSYKCGYIDEPLFKYVLHSDSHSHVKRTYDMENARRDNFNKLIKSTIININDMPDREKSEWINYASNRQLYRKYMNSITYHKFGEFKKFRKEIKNKKIHLEFFEYYFLYDIYYLFYRINRKLKKVYKNGMLRSIL